MLRRMFARLAICAGMLAASNECWAQFTNFAVIYAFGTNASQGFTPRANVIQASDGWLYGTTWTGGATNDGAIYKISTNGTGYTLLHSFTDSFLPVQDGGVPVSPVIEGVDGALYGTTAAGSIYKLNKDGSGYTNLYFSAGISFDGTLVQGTNRMLYGTDANGGTNAQGEIFRLATNGLNFTSLHSFAGGLNIATSDGSGPEAGLLLASDGQFYGDSAGLIGMGTVFHITHGGTNYTIIQRFDFNVPTNGLGPRAGLLEGVDGLLYGTTASGGINDAGLLFKETKTGGTYTILHLFDGTNGATPYHSTLVQADNGVIYGTASEGASNGVVFRIGTNGVGYTVLHAFLGMDGSSPVAGLLKSHDGTFFGTTQQGGPNDEGVLYQLPKPNSKPFFLTQLQSQTNFIGSTTIFSPIGLSDTNVFYQWTHSGVSLSGHQEAALTFSNTVATNAGTYSVIVSNVFGSVTSAVVTLTVIPAPPKPVLVFGPILSGANFIARYSGAPGTNYTVEIIPAFPGTNWTKLTNMVAPTVDQGFGVGVFQLLDPVISSANRFYRVVWPAY
ncbi:MAG TPA: choice-of-anchor tandem repeat GloVer-containing protein [Verrucomicrobiae bacterium]|jgi:uncharacterized repeat protein (TIGR03803 family)|nr:choice-of-anchor tandem repeat GloVer-containing protein [Verrucomicrobiae bacterium]